MPVGFENCQPSGLPGPDANGWTILRFLAATPEAGYRAGKIVEALDTPRKSAGTTLSRLHNQGFVRHKDEYWAINPGVYDVHTASLTDLAVVSGQFGGGYYDENPDWDANLPNLDESEGTDSGTEWTTSGPNSEALGLVPELWLHCRPSLQRLESTDKPRGSSWDH